MSQFKLRILFLSILTFSSHSWAEGYRPLQNFIDGSRAAISENNRMIWIGGTALTLVALNFDHAIEKSYSDDREIKFIDSVGDVFGTGVPGALIAGFQLLAGYRTDNARVFKSGQAHAESLVATFVYTSSLKFAINRPRPSGFGESSRYNASFPSGHTSTAFATAGSLWASEGAAIGVPSAILAVLTGYSRIQQRKHYLSDTIFGATLGVTMALGFSELHTQMTETVALEWLPYFSDRENFGAVATIRF